MRELTDKRVLVTGGAGFIGSHLVDELLHHDLAGLVVVDNFFLGKPENLAQAKARWPELVVEKASAADLPAMRRICRHHAVDVIFNLAVVPLPTSLVRPKFTVEENVNSVVAVCELCREKEVDTLIHFSSSEIYGTALRVPMDEDHPKNPLTPYAASKSAGDHIVLSYVETFGVDAAIVRPFNNYGPRQNEKEYAGVIPKVIKQTLAGQQVLVSGDGQQTRDYIFVTDTARGAIECYRREHCRGLEINLGGGREVVILDLVRQIVALAGGDPDSAAFGPQRPADVRRHCAGVARAKALLDFSPRVGLEEGLAATVGWYVQQLGV